MIFSIALLWGAFCTTLIFLFKHLLSPKDTLRERIEKLYEQAGEQSLALEISGTSKRSLEHAINQRLEGTGIQIKLNELLAASGLISFVVLLFLWGVTDDFVFSFLLAAISFVLVPYVFVERRRKRRLLLIDEQLSEALTIMSSALQSGFSIQQAFGLLEEEMPSPMSEEMGRINQELRLGQPMDKVLENFKERIPSQDIDMFVSAVLIQRRLGGNLREVLDNISSTIQDRVSLKREIAAKTAMARTSSWLLSLSPAGMFVLLYIVNPEYILDFMADELGMMLLLIAGMLNLAGVYMCSKMVKIDGLEAKRKK